jgi:glycosyltransferase involved in cell wall biosynthesis
MKGHLTFVRAAAALREELPSARFVIYGQIYPHYRAYAEQVLSEARAAGFAVGSDFRIIDPGSRVSGLIQALDLYWVTSEPNSEGISIAAEEAMTLGIPVISTNTGSMLEIVRHEKTGFMVGTHDVDAFKDFTVLLVKNTVLRSELGSNAWQFACDHFDANRCARLHSAAYRAAAGDRGALTGVPLWK